MFLLTVPWLLYLHYHPSLSTRLSSHILPSQQEIVAIFNYSKVDFSHAQPVLPATFTTSVAAVSPSISHVFGQFNTTKLPVLGPVPTDGSKPLFGVQHAGGDAVFALACNYPRDFYKRFVGSLRKSQFNGDIVLAVSPPEKMKPGVQAYIKEMNVVAYAFDVDCAGIDNCRLKDDFLGYPDPRPYRTFANIRYALYEYWLRYYSETSYILILDFRDTFFQADPFLPFGPIEQRKPKYELQLFAENFKVFFSIFFFNQETQNFILFFLQFFFFLWLI